MKTCENTDGWSFEPETAAANEEEEDSQIDDAYRAVMVELVSREKPKRQLSEAEAMEEFRFWSDKFEAVLLSEPAKRLLQKAIECCPSDMDSWLDLAKSESYEDADTAIDEACSKLPKEIAPWIAAAKLDEAHGIDTEKVRRVVYKGLSVVQRRGGVVDRREWVKQTLAAEEAGYVVTSQAMSMFASMIKDEESRSTSLM